MNKSISTLIDKVKIRRGYSGYLYCQICKKKFKSTQARVERGLGKYCSKKCYGQAVSGKSRPGIGQKISDTKKSKGVYVDFKCEVCGKEIKFSPANAKGRRTCSRECMGVLVSQRLKKMWENPPDSLIEKLRAARTISRKKGRINKETAPERAFREEMEKRQVIFEQQFGFGGMMIADFFIPSLQAFIFIDGSYWHSLPSSKEKDWQQVAYIRSKGMKAYRFTDKQVFEDASSCLDEVFEDSFQPFSFADLIDSFTILGIKTEYAKEDKLKQVIKDYRRMNKLLISGIEFYKYSNPEKIVKSIKDLLDTNIEIFNLVDLIQTNLHTKEDAKKLHDLNFYRSQLKNSINEEFSGRIEVKI